jgi:P-type Cu2+ transporter
LIEAGEQSRSLYVRLADKAAEVYVPLVHGAALLTAVVWLWIGADPRTAIMNACAVLIITCPCALGLAVPAVQIVATGQLFRRGILVKSGDALERLANVRHVAFDKTGVITLGQPKLINGAEIEPDDLAAAALLARASRHPLARALAREAGPGPAIKGTQEIAGCGVEADWEGTRARLGRAAWCGAPEASSEETELWFTRQGHAPLRFAFEDSVRVDARATVNALSEMNISQEILSGDREEAVRRAANEAGIAQFRAELHPADKAAALALLGTQGTKSLMVGDGLNDAPALAAAYVSMAPGAAADASQSAADLVFQGDKLDSVRASIQMAQLAKARILENFAFSALYNLIAAPLAMFGLVTPFIAAIAMSSSSIIVTLNALRLVRALPDNPKGDPTWTV